MARTSWPTNGPLGEFTPEKAARLEQESQAKALAGAKFYREGGAAELEVDMLMLRDSNLRERANELDDDFDGDVAAKAVTGVDAAWGEPDEDAAVADPDRYDRYLAALDAALWQVAEDYREAPQRPSRSGWESEAFPKTVLGLT